MAMDVLASIAVRVPEPNPTLQLYMLQALMFVLFIWSAKRALFHNRHGRALQQFADSYDRLGEVMRTPISAEETATWAVSLEAAAAHSVDCWCKIRTLDPEAEPPQEWELAIRICEQTLDALQ